jgi:hypothetical protein
MDIYLHSLTRLHGVVLRHRENYFLCLDFIHRQLILSFKKSLHFEGWIFLRLQVKKEDTPTLLDPADRDFTICERPIE